jgi:hypothetical protein
MGSHASKSLVNHTFMVRNETDKNTNLLADFSQAAQGVMVEWAANRVGVGVPERLPGRLTISILET